MPFPNLVQAEDGVGSRSPLRTRPRSLHRQRLAEISLAIVMRVREVRRAKGAGGDEEGEAGWG
jgi:hypothetical protein